MTILPNNALLVSLMRVKLTTAILLIVCGLSIGWLASKHNVGCLGQTELLV